jgi:hypothetical protein
MGKHACRGKILIPGRFVDVSGRPILKPEGITCSQEQTTFVMKMIQTAQ